MTLNNMLNFMQVFFVRLREFNYIEKTSMKIVIEYALILTYRSNIGKSMSRSYLIS